MYYPVMLNISGRLVVVIGGGSVAARKVRELVESGARVHIISPEINDEVEAIISQNQGMVELSKRAYKKGDLQGAALVYSTTDDVEVNKKVFNEAEELNIFINAVDDPDNCSFIVPSVIRRRDLIVAVSTSGSSPAMAARLRREMEKSLPVAVEETLEKLKAARTLLKDDNDFSHLSSSQRGAVLKKIVNDDELLTSLLTAHDTDSLKRILLTIT